jgi:hypothetical protein
MQNYIGFSLGRKVNKGIVKAKINNYLSILLLQQLSPEINKKSSINH